MAQCAVIISMAAGLEVLERKAMNMKKPAHPAMKKPVSRATLLEYLLSDFIEVEDMLLQLELRTVLGP